jgi:hypothetical protein
LLVQYLKHKIKNLIEKEVYVKNFFYLKFLSIHLLMISQVLIAMTKDVTIVPSDKIVSIANMDVLTEFPRANEVVSHTPHESGIFKVRHQYNEFRLQCNGEEKERTQKIISYVPRDERNIGKHIIPWKPDEVFCHYMERAAGMISFLGILNFFSNPREQRRYDRAEDPFSGGNWSSYTDKLVKYRITQLKRNESNSYFFDMSPLETITLPRLFKKIVPIDSDQKILLGLGENGYLYKLILKGSNSVLEERLYVQLEGNILEHTFSDIFIDEIGGVIRVIANGRFGAKSIFSIFLNDLNTFCTFKNIQLTTKGPLQKIPQLKLTKDTLVLMDHDTQYIDRDGNYTKLEFGAKSPAIITQTFVTKFLNKMVEHRWKTAISILILSFIGVLYFSENTRDLFFKLIYAICYVIHRQITINRINKNPGAHIFYLYEGQNKSVPYLYS